MCGIVGFIDQSASVEQREDDIIPMSQTLSHRGPDDFGFWCDKSSGTTFGHRRLSILDLSALGHQPMFSESGRYVITYNGEIYNYGEIGEELKQNGHVFRGHSDTEVMLAAMEQWGISSAAQRFNGMFAFAVYDRKEPLCAKSL